VIEAAGFEKLDIEAGILSEAVSDARGVSDPGGIFHRPPTYTVRFYTVLPLADPMTHAVRDATALFSVIVGPEKAYAQITTEPEGGIVWGGGEGPPTIEGAEQLARRMVEFVRPGAYDRSG